eukprot:scaffold185184_cov29-Tisochrysis_lutea.AAC.8
MRALARPPPSRFARAAVALAEDEPVEARCLVLREVDACGCRLAAGVATRDGLPWAVVITVRIHLLPRDRAPAPVAAVARQRDAPALREVRLTRAAKETCAAAVLALVLVKGADLAVHGQIGSRKRREAAAFVWAVDCRNRGGE